MYPVNDFTDLNSSVQTIVVPCLSGFLSSLNAASEPYEVLCYGELNALHLPILRGKIIR